MRLRSWLVRSLRFSGAWAVPLRPLASEVPGVNVREAETRLGDVSHESRKLLVAQVPAGVAEPCGDLGDQLGTAAGVARRPQG